MQWERAWQLDSFFDLIGLIYKRAPLWNKLMMMIAFIKQLINQ